MELNIDGISLPGSETIEQIKRAAPLSEEEGLNKEKK
jgi:hypothetical protein